MRNVVFYDLETTGLDRNPANIRIIEIAAIKVNIETLEEIDHYTRKCNNDGVRISSEAYAKCGISEEDVADCKTFTEIAGEVFEFFKGCDVGGYYNTYYDNPILYTSFLRAGYTWDFRNLKVYDIYSLYRKYNSSTLSSVYKRYTGKEMTGSHQAFSDIAATLEIYKAQRENGEEFEKEELNAYEDNLDISGNIKVRTNIVGAKELYLNFGKYKGVSVDMIDNNYFKWMYERSDLFPSDTRYYAKKIYEKRAEI